MLCCILSAATLASAQTATTSLRGTVKDSSGALVQGASIVLSDKANGRIYKAVSSTSGFYSFPVIPPARYLITVTSTGFATQTETAELLVDQPATVDFSLSVQSNSVTVDVSAAAETLNLTDATMGNSVGNAMIEAVPMEGRNPTSLLSLQPGVLYIGQQTESADSRQGAVAGGRSDQGNITLDGLDDNDQINGTAFAGVLRSRLDRGVPRDHLERHGRGGALFRRAGQSGYQERNQRHARQPLRVLPPDQYRRKRLLQQKQ
jgi:hypothetical protein